MDPLWQESGWQAVPDGAGQQEAAVRVEDISPSAWAGWWHEGCPGL
ncbi:hypothetical protein LVY72_02615 [Arthrobacter sp. I2-34]|uniref:Uncharacterized protein n=1 Tax=Arthrobacter hankyongi TaxID=2904801 RepID=A0ABS9L276_9MICC|nr:hypothetical protein [Arthrobacter hankyongi]MCG2620802.1 hypothetical protein [Arthrobacter hankyongi]